MNNKEGKKRLETELPFDPEIPLLGIDPKQMDQYVRKLHSCVYCNTIYNTKEMETITVYIN
jgi:hypothetical protein